MNFKLHFISFDMDWVDAMEERFADISGVVVTHGNINSLSRENTVFVSPANSLGYMDGGIDYVLSREMFPGLQTIIQDLIAEHGVVNAFGRHYLPVGSALAATRHLIVAPTMFQPRDVSRTRNAYWSMLAALTLFHKHYKGGDERLTLVVTSHCCGYGCMDSVESATQMHAAYLDFVGGLGTRLDTEIQSYKVRFPLEIIDDGSQGVIADGDVKEIYIYPL